MVLMTKYDLGWLEGRDGIVWSSGSDVVEPPGPAWPGRSIFRKRRVGLVERLGVSLGTCSSNASRVSRHSDDGPIETDDCRRRPSDDASDYPHPCSVPMERATTRRAMPRTRFGSTSLLGLRLKNQSPDTWVAEFQIPNLLASCISVRRQI